VEIRCSVCNTVKGRFRGGSILTGGIRGTDLTRDSGEKGNGAVNEEGGKTRRRKWGGGTGPFKISFPSHHRDVHPLEKGEERNGGR